MCIPSPESVRVPSRIRRATSGQLTPLQTLRYVKICIMHMYKYMNMGSMHMYKCTNICVYPPLSR